MALPPLHRRRCGARVAFQQSPILCIGTCDSTTVAQQRPEQVALRFLIRRSDTGPAPVVRDSARGASAPHVQAHIEAQLWFGQPVDQFQQ